MNPMTTLNNPACAAVVAKLFADADASDANLHAQRDALSPEEQARFMAGAENYRAFYGSLQGVSSRGVARDGNTCSICWRDRAVPGQSSNSAPPLACRPCIWPRPCVTTAADDW